MTTRKRLRRAIHQMHDGWTFVDDKLARLAGRVVSRELAVIGDKQPNGTAFRIVERTLLPFYAGSQVICQ